MIFLSNHRRFSTSVNPFSSSKHLNNRLRVLRGRRIGNQNKAIKEVVSLLVPGSHGGPQLRTSAQLLQTLLRAISKAVRLLIKYPFKVKQTLFSPCEHYCENDTRSYYCACHSGFMLAENGYSCEGIVNRCLNITPADYTST